MNERIKILKMLENGDITAEEASKLLSAIEVTKPDSEKTYTRQNSQTNDQRESKINIDFSNITNKIGKVTQKVAKKTAEIYNEVSKEVKDIAKNINNSSHSNKNSFVKEFNFILNDYENDIELKSLNGEMVLKGYNGDKLTLKVVYIPKTKDANVDFYNPSNKNYMLLFKEEEFEKVSIEALVPKKYFRNLKINSLNSNFSIEGIDFENIQSDTVKCNGIIENCKCQNVKLDNVNGKFIIRESNFKNLKLSNINDYVKLNNVDIEKMSIDVLNGEISLKNDYLNAYEDYDWSFETQNNPINLEINTQNIQYDIDAKTSLGKVNVLKNNLNYLEKTDYSVVAKSEDNIAYFKKLKLSLQTSNSEIFIK